MPAQRSTQKRGGNQTNRPSSYDKETTHQYDMMRLRRHHDNGKRQSILPKPAHASRVGTAAFTIARHGSSYDEISSYYWTGMEGMQYQLPLPQFEWPSPTTTTQYGLPSAWSGPQSIAQSYPTFYPGPSPSMSGLSATPPAATGMARIDSGIGMSPDKRDEMDDIIADMWAGVYDPPAAAGQLPGPVPQPQESVQTLGVPALDQTPNHQHNVVVPTPPQQDYQYGMVVPLQDYQDVKDSSPPEQPDQQQDVVVTSTPATGLPDSPAEESDFTWFLRASWEEFGGELPGW
ncbi:Hypothetical protein D9617_11g008720 [Elsinoe fawcettii]|nr:Hypothetical protein D9617_11g008720 [Elsinoe fawcettii]